MARTQEEIDKEWNALNTLFNQAMIAREQGKGMPSDGKMILACKDVLDWVNGDNDTAPSEELRAEMNLS